VIFSLDYFLGFRQISLHLQLHTMIERVSIAYNDFPASYAFVGWQFNVAYLALPQPHRMVGNHSMGLGST